MKPQNKKADFILVEFGVKLVIGVLCLVSLIVIAVYISRLFTEQTEKKQAEATLKEIINQIDYLKKSQFNEIKYDLRSPRDWYIFYGSSGTKTLLCICPRDSYESCKEGSCQRIGNITLADSVLHKPIASKSAEILILKKSANEEITISKEK